MIDPTQNTKRMSAGNRGSYTLRANEDFKNWKNIITDFFDKLKTDKKLEDTEHEVEEYKSKIEKQKVEVEEKLKEMEKVADHGWDDAKASLEDSLNSISSTLDELKQKVK